MPRTNNELTEPSDTELTLREYGWITSDELLSDEVILSPFSRAVKELDERFWTEFVDGIREKESSALTFFNTNTGEFLPGDSWEALASIEGLTDEGVFDSVWRIPTGISKACHDFCVQIRQWCAETDSGRRCLVPSDTQVFVVPDESYPKSDLLWVNLGLALDCSRMVEGSTSLEVGEICAMFIKFAAETRGLKQRRIDPDTILIERL